MQLSENTQSVKLHFLKTKNFSFFEDVKICPTIITLPPRNHHINFRAIANINYKLPSNLA